MTVDRLPVDSAVEIDHAVPGEDFAQPGGFEAAVHELHNLRGRTMGFDEEAPWRSDAPHVERQHPEHNADHDHDDQTPLDAGMNDIPYRDRGDQPAGNEPLEEFSFDESGGTEPEFDETAANAAGFAEPAFDDDLPDIPEVPFSVRAASMWGAAPAMPSTTSPARDDDLPEDGTDDLRFGGDWEEQSPAGPAAHGRAGADPGTGPMVLDEAQAWQRLLRLVERHPGRLVLGISGSPGAGKTTYADYLAACCVDAAVIGVDGFQLSSVALTRMGRGARRGAPDTFDLDGYLALLRRLRRDDQKTVWAPEYWRDLEEPVAGAVAVRPSTRVVVTEGNYLLLPQRQWLEARALCHEVWYVEVPERVRVERLVGRHRHYGRSKAQARARVTVGVDAENAHVVAATRDRADVVVRLSLSAEEYA